MSVLARLYTDDVGSLGTEAEEPLFRPNSVRGRMYRALSHGQPVHQDELCLAGWGPVWFWPLGYTDCLNVHICEIRKALRYAGGREVVRSSVYQIVEGH